MDGCDGVMNLLDVMECVDVLTHALHVAVGVMSAVPMCVLVDYCVCVFDTRQFERTIQRKWSSHP